MLTTLWSQYSASDFFREKPMRQLTMSLENCWKMCIIFRSHLGTHWCKFDHKMIKPISQLKNSQQFAKSHGAVLCCTPWASGPVVWHPTCCRHLWRTKCQATRPSWRFGSWNMWSWIRFRWISTQPDSFGIYFWWRTEYGDSSSIRVSSELAIQVACHTETHLSVESHH